MSTISAAAMLSGCASAVVDESTFFVDPARFALYDCKQLSAARAAYAIRVEELQGLMAKAETGAGGAVISEVAYRPDYLSAQGSLKAVNAALERNRCASEGLSGVPAVSTPQPGTQPAVGHGRSRAH